MLLKQSTTRIRMFKMIDSADHFSKKTGLTCTVNISKNGGAFGAAGGSVTELANGWYYVTLNTTDTNTLGDLAFYITATGADDTDFADQVVVDLPGTILGDTAGVTTLLTRLPSAITLSGGAVTIGTNNDKTGYALSSAGVQAIWDALTSALTTVGSIGKLLVTNLDTVVSAIKTKTDQLVFTIANKVDAQLSGTQTFNMTGSITGNLSGSVGSVTGAVGSVTVVSDKTGYSLSSGGVQAIWDALTSTLTSAGSIGKWILDKLDVIVSTRLASASITLTSGKVDVNDKTGFSLSGAGITAIWDKLTSALSTAGSIGKLLVDNINATISSRLASASITLTGGAVTVGTITDKTGYSLSSAGIQAIWDALTSALSTVGSIGKLLVDNINATISSRLPTSSITLSGGSVTVGSNSDKTGYTLSSVGVDNILDDTPGTELSAVPSATASLRQMIQFLYQYFKNQKKVTTSAETLYKDDSISILGTCTVSDDGVTFTKGKMS